MKLSILHVSDLHRDPENPIRNEPLIESLVRDQQRFTSQETPSIRPPDIIVISGDVIYGVESNSPNPTETLAKQYNEALQFLNQLADRFVDGDKRKVIIMPGNHDMSAFHFKQALENVTIAKNRKKELVSQLFTSDSVLRWSWSEFKLYRIVDQKMYQMRLSAFSQFYSQFYENNIAYSLQTDEQFDIFDYPEFNVTVAAFNSCYKNDILNKQGAIHPDCIAGVTKRLRHSAYNGRLRLAAWHHNTEGLPIQSDYIDPGILQNLIDSGFSLGLHGHKHESQFMDERFKYGSNRRITIIGAGTLCGNTAFGRRRSYNMIELDLDERKGRLHLRGMLNDDLSLPIWGKSTPHSYTNSFMDFSFDPPPEPFVPSSTDTQTLLRAQKLYDDTKYEEAATVFKSLADSNDLARRVLLECYIKTKNAQAIVADFDKPQSITEAICLMDALWEQKEQGLLRDLLNKKIVVDSTDPSVIEHTKKYKARLKL